MKIAVINRSGNVGKTTISRLLLLPRMPKGAKVIAIETTNADGAEEDAYRGSQYGILQEQLLMVDHAVVDFGSSNFEMALELMKKYRGSHEDFDYYLVPTVSGKQKILNDTIGTIEALADLGVPPQKIRVLLNMSENEMPWNGMVDLRLYHSEDNSFTWNELAVLGQNEIYDMVKEVAVDLRQIVADKTDYKQKLAKSKNMEEKLACAQMISLKRLAVGVVEEHDAIYETLFVEIKPNSKDEAAA